MGLTKDHVRIVNGKLFFIPSGSEVIINSQLTASVQGAAIISCSNNYNNALAKPNLRYTQSIGGLVTQSDYTVNGRNNETGYFLFSTTKRIIVCY